MNKKDDARRELPSFKDPPVIEVTLSVQFEPLVKLRTPHLGLFWSRLRTEFPIAEERPPLPPAIEIFGLDQNAGDLRLEVLQVPHVSRCWFLNSDGSELIQLQQDRFVVNWRKTSKDAQYPRYPHVRDLFFSRLRQFSEFLDDEDLGELRYTQCEVTYVNHFVRDKGWSRPGQLGDVVTVWNSNYSDEFLSEPEDVKFSVRYAMCDKENRLLGRLHISTEPRYSGSETGATLVMILTSRGAPAGEGVAGVLDFLDQGRSWIVRGFSSITSKKMHEMWGRDDNS